MILSATAPDSTICINHICAGALTSPVHFLHFWSALELNLLLMLLHCYVPHVYQKTENIELLLTPFLHTVHGHIFPRTLISLLPCSKASPFLIAICNRTDLPANRNHSFPMFLSIFQAIRVKKKVFGQSISVHFVNNLFGHLNITDLFYSIMSNRSAYLAYF